MARESSARLLALLGLFQSRNDWTGTELAERLGVSPRTVRNDIDRLRRLDYPVDAVRGRDGHYRLGVGAKLPPLLLNDEEAVAITVGLAAATGITGIEETAPVRWPSSRGSCRTGSGARSMRCAGRSVPARRTPEPTCPTRRSRSGS